VLECSQFVDTLRDAGVSFFAGVPDSLLKDLCAYFDAHLDGSNHVISSNEGSAVALAAGHHLATGNVGAVYLQNSGQGNLINPLLSLADPAVYGIPMLLIVGWRGEPGKHDEPQHRKQGEVTLPIFDACETPTFILPSEPLEAHRCLTEAVSRAKAEQRPVAVVVRKGSFAAFKGKQASSGYTVTREAVVQAIAATLDERDVVVATTGKISRELYETRVAAGKALGQDFYTVGSMGYASQIALGVALSKPDRQVFCLDGDGALIMHMGSLATIGGSGSANLKHIVLNNGAHDSVGGQPTVGFDIDLPGIANACGYAFYDSIDCLEKLPRAMARLRAANGPGFLEIRVACGSRADLGRPTTTPSQNKLAFMERLG
jgi:phosphonopyruvate decarboxylase